MKRGGRRNKMAAPRRHFPEQESKRAREKEEKNKSKLPSLLLLHQTTWKRTKKIDIYYIFINKKEER